MNRGAKKPTGPWDELKVTGGRAASNGRLVKLKKRRRSNVANIIEGRGWFVFTLSALVAGTKEAAAAILASPYNPYTKEGGEGIGELIQFLDSMAAAGFARVSRTGWRVIEHPELGQLSWKSGYDFRSGGEIFLPPRQRKGGAPVPAQGRRPILSGGVGLWS